MSRPKFLDLPAVPKEVVGPSGTRYAMVDGSVCTPTNKSAYAERWEWHPVFKMIPIEDAPTVAQLMQEEK